MASCGMHVARAFAIFNSCFCGIEDENRNINANLYTDEEIISAIYRVVCASHNSVGKETMANALRWLLEEYVIDEEDTQDDN